MNKNLTPENVTAASRIMLPVYVGFFGIVGANFILTPLTRLLESPGLEFANTIISIRAWGILFVIASIIMLGGLIVHERNWFRFGLILSTSVAGIWSLSLVLGVFLSDVSPSAWTWPAFVTAACIASYRSLSKGER